MNNERETLFFESRIQSFLGTDPQARKYCAWVTARVIIENAMRVKRDHHNGNLTN